MERIHGTCISFKFQDKDFISRMPDNVVSNILDRLPVQEAVRTGILARDWRFKWTLLTQLVFDSEFFQYLLKTKNEKKYGRIISRLIFHLKGVITKFSIYIDYHFINYNRLDNEDISNWILFLSRNGIKDLTMDVDDTPSITHLFSCLDLKHLNLRYCYLKPPANFNGFPNLLSLELCEVEFQGNNFAEFFTGCPVLEILNMHFTDDDRHLPFRKGDAINGSLTIFPCLKTLQLSNIELGSGIMSSSAIEMIRSAPNLQCLEITSCNSCYDENVAIKRSHITFPCLKTFKLLEVDFGNGNMLSFAYEVIMNSPNLQTLEITVGDLDLNKPPAIYSFEVDYNTTRMLQLRSVVFRGLKDLDNEVCFIKYLLACSPFLKTIDIRPASFLEYKKMYKIAKKLLKLHRASSVAEISLY